jgi:hypothetical protein
MSDIGDIKLKGKIWKKEMFDLIDYDNIDFILSNLTISESGMLYRINNQITFTNQINKILKSFELIQILKTEKDYMIITEHSKCDLKNISKEKVAFFVYKGMSFKQFNSNTKTKYKWYKLNEGDIFKLGRVYIKVLKIKLQDENEKTSERILSHRHFSSNSLIEQNIIRGSFTNRNRKIKIFQNEISNEIKSVLLPKISSYQNIFKLDIDKYSNNKKIIKKNNNTCRICYNNEESIENPLINPCKCSGSMEYIHYKCLKNWLFSKIQNKDSDITISYNISNFKCELCKENFPDYIKYNNKLYNLILFESKFNQYIVVETVRDDKFKTRFLHIISYDDKKTISIGRSSECELSIPELSISRNHCLIHKVNLNLFLEDNFSKFGTLVLIQNPKVKIINNLPLKIQVGKTYLKFILEKKSSFFSCCNCRNNEDDIIFSYQRQNLKFLNIYRNVFIKNIKIYEDDDENEKEFEIKKVKILNNNNSKSSLPLLSLDNSKLTRRSKPINLRTNSIIRNTNTTGIISLYNNENHRNNIYNNNSGNLIRLNINRINNNNNNQNIAEVTHSVLNDE